MVRLVLGLWLALGGIAHAGPALVARPQVEAPGPATRAYTWPLEHAPRHAPHLALDFDAVHCAQLRDDGLRLTRYTRAWCAVDLRERLEALRGIVDDDARGTIGAAAHADLVDELADHAGERTAMGWLATAHAPPALYDEIVATLVEEGRTGDARALAAARPAAPASLDVACWRAVQLDGEPSFAAIAHEVRAAGHAATEVSLCDNVLAAWRCARSLASLEPWLLTADCEMDAAARPGERRAVELAIAVRAWPAETADWQAWAEVARHAARALPLPGAEDVAIAALTNAHRVGGCDAASHAAVRELAAVLLGAFERTDASDARLRALVLACP